MLTDQPLGGSALAAPQVLSDEGGVLALVAHGDVVSEGEVALSLVFRATTEIETRLLRSLITRRMTASWLHRLALPAPVQLQTRPERSRWPTTIRTRSTRRRRSSMALPQAADVELIVYNVVGQVVRTLLPSIRARVRYVVEWDAANDSGHSLSSGMYFYRLEAGGEFLETKKMLLLK